MADGDRGSGAEPMRLSPDQLVNRTLERAGTGNLALQRSAAVFGTDRHNTATVDELDRLSTQSAYSFDRHRERARVECSDRLELTIHLWMMISDHQNLTGACTINRPLITMHD